MADVTTNPGSRYGSVVEGEFASATDAHKPALTEWLAALPGLDDEHFFWQAASAIHASALANSFRGNWDHEHCKGTAAYREAQDRHHASGHSKDCTGDTIYSRAHRQVWLEQGHDPEQYPPSPCDCGAEADR